MSKTCSKCGGTLQLGECKLCEMFDTQSPPGGTCTGWPMKSRSLSVLPGQAREANEHLAANGVSAAEAYYYPDGTLEIASAKAKKKVMKAKSPPGREMVDFQSFN